MNLRIHRGRITHSLFLFFCCGSIICDNTYSDQADEEIAPESETSAKTEKLEPLVRKISSSLYQIGLIKLNKDTREITLPAQTNITDPGTLLEYLLVHSNGEKIHESLLVTEADPMHLNIALKLLNYKESPELFSLPREDGTPSGKFPEVDKELKAAARLGVYITREENKVQKTTPATQWIQHSATGKPMPSTPWVYTGSYIHENKFNAKLTGNMLTIFHDQGSIAGYPGKDRWDDTLWLPSPGLPEVGAPVTVTLKPWPNEP